MFVVAIAGLRNRDDVISGLPIQAGLPDLVFNLSSWLRESAMIVDVLGCILLGLQLLGIAT